MTARASRVATPLPALVALGFIVAIALLPDLTPDSGEHPSWLGVDPICRTLQAYVLGVSLCRSGWSRPGARHRRFSSALT